MVRQFAFSFRFSFELFCFLDFFSNQEFVLITQRLITEDFPQPQGPEITKGCLKNENFKFKKHEVKSLSSDKFSNAEKIIMQTAFMYYLVLFSLFVSPSISLKK